MAAVAIMTVGIAVKTRGMTAIITMIRKIDTDNIKIMVIAIKCYQLYTLMTKIIIVITVQAQ